MRKPRHSWLLAVHRWLFYFAVIVVVASALSRIDEDASPRVVDAGQRSSSQTTNAGEDPRDDDDAPPFVAFAGCP
jgi:hypothetical protein